MVMKVIGSTSLPLHAGVPPTPTGQPEPGLPHRGTPLNGSATNAMAPKPTRKPLIAWITAAFTLLLAGCGDHHNQPAGPALNRSQTSNKKLVQLEGTGAIPSLERFPSIEGIDLNTNGVRDDIEHYIQQKYTIEIQRDAAMQAARAIQQALTVDPNDREATILTSENISNAINCASNVFTGEDKIENFSQVLTQIESMTTNTKERLNTYLRYNKTLNGTVSRLPEGDTCEYP